MRCNDFRGLIDAYFDGETTPAEREAADRHIAGCDACRAALEELRLTWEALDAVPEPAIPALCAPAIIHRARLRERRVTWLTFAGAAAAVAVLAFALWSTGLLGGGMPGEVGIEDQVAADADLTLDMLENLEVLEALDLESIEILQSLDFLENPPPDLLEDPEDG